MLKDAKSNGLAHLQRTAYVPGEQERYTRWKQISETAEAHLKFALEALPDTNRSKEHLSNAALQFEQQLELDRETASDNVNKWKNVANTITKIVFLRTLNHMPREKVEAGIKALLGTNVSEPLLLLRRWMGKRKENEDAQAAFRQTSSLYYQIVSLDLIKPFRFDGTYDIEKMNSALDSLTKNLDIMSATAIAESRDPKAGVS